MKRILLLWLAALLCVTGALAETSGFWTANEDWYYHAIEYCGGAEGMVPISLEGAAEFGKYPCAACVQTEDDAAEPRAAALDGMIVVRFSDAWMARQELVPVFGYGGYDVEKSVEEQSARLAELLHGEAYAAFLEGGREAWARYPDLVYREIMLNARHIRSAWYVIVRPEEAEGERWNRYWRVDANRVWMEDGVLYTSMERQTIEENRTMELEVNRAASIYRRDGDLSIEVYEVMDTYAALIREADADPNLLENVGLRIGAVRCGQSLNGRADGDAALYACILTEAEVNALRGGAQPAIVRKPPADAEAYQDTPYAVATYGSSGKQGIVDREGNYVVEPIYDSVYRPDFRENHVVGSCPFFCQRRDGSSVILDGETLEVIVESERHTSYENPAVYRETESDFIAFLSESATFRSLQDGSMLFDFVSDENSYVTGRYEVRIDGLPQRMVYRTGSGANRRDMLIDNRGTTVLGTEYQRITALYWLGEHGVFLAERFDPGEYDVNDFAGEDYYRYGEVYTGEGYGANWRCGLIDENGGVLAELEYISIECTQDGEIRLGREDGSILTLSAFEIGA